MKMQEKNSQTQSKMKVIYFFTDLKRQLSKNLKLKKKNKSAIKVLVNQALSVNTVVGSLDSQNHEFESQYQHCVNKDVIGSWWWSSGPRACLLLRQS